MSSVNNSIKVKLRSLPSVDHMLLQLDDAISTYGHQSVTAVVRHELAECRRRILDDDAFAFNEAAIMDSVLGGLQQRAEPSLRRVLNLTGTVLHTNLGRAVLPQEAINAIAMASGGFTNLEFDLHNGKRGNRETHVEALICELTGAEAATVVNNNAAAVLLVLNTLALNGEVPVSRGELVEIGGSFRIPEVMQRANCRLVEIGATNRTHLDDYRAAVTENTALLMKVHTSNYRIEGFTREASVAELASLAKALKLPLVMDLGSGSLVNLAAFGLPAEPTARQILGDGADVITFSGDKLLGGPQSGLIAGRRKWIDKIRKNPLKRALRLDKMTLAGLAAVLELYRDPDSLQAKLPTMHHLTRPAAEIRAIAERIAPRFQEILGDRFEVAAIDTEAQIGSGSLPTRMIQSAAVEIRPASDNDSECRELADAFRSLPTPVLGYLHKRCLRFDLRCLDDEQTLVSQLQSLQV